MATQTGDSIQLGATKLTLTLGDITKISADALVNAANTKLSGGGGVDGAIHKVGGPTIKAECDAIREADGGCETGLAVKTGAGDLPAKMVFHAVGPVWSGGFSGEYVALESAYKSSLSLGKIHEARTLAFPSLSTGAYKFPVDRAAEVALMTIARFCLENPDTFDQVTIVLHSDEDYKIYEEELDLMARTKLG